MTEEDLHRIKTSYALIDRGVNTAFINSQIYNVLHKENPEVKTSDVKAITDKRLKIHDAMHKFKELID